MGITGVGRLIHRIRGKCVMIDADIARLYGVRTKELNKAVRRNIERFPDDFMFVLSGQEHRALRFQFGTLEKGRHSKYLPLAFTREGIAMLSSVLRSERAVRVNVAIMRAFAGLSAALLPRGDKESRLLRAERSIRAHELELGEHAAQLNELYSRMRRRI